MLTTWDEIPMDSGREATVIWHPTASAADVIAGTATDGFDLTPYVAQARQTAGAMDILLRYHTELVIDVTSSNACGSYTVTGPEPGHWIEVMIGDAPLWRGFIYTINDNTEARGTRQMRLSVRSREQSEAWKSVKRVTNLYLAGAALDSIAKDVCLSMGLQPHEYKIPSLGLYVVHQNLQLADDSAWGMLQTLFWPAQYEPWVNALGVLTVANKNMTRRADKTVAKERVLSVNQGRARMPVNSIKLKWLDPQLSKAYQVSQVLGTATITAGFFQLHQKKDIWFGADHYQRAEMTYMKVLQSANSGLVDFVDESYQQLDDFHGKITLTTSTWEPALISISIGGLFASSRIGDEVLALIEGWTVPVGTFLTTLSEIGIFLTMSCIGTGHYEVWGQPYDWVHARNITEAFDQGAEPWAENRVDAQCDFITTEAQAQMLAANELRYQNYLSKTCTVEIQDDLNIEKGDILQLWYGDKFYVLDYSRDLTRGAKATIQLTCFRIP
jgi:hypothetical protein